MRDRPWSDRLLLPREVRRRLHRSEVRLRVVDHGQAVFLEVAIVPRGEPWLAEHPGGAEPALVWLGEVRFAEDDEAGAATPSGP